MLIALIKTGIFLFPFLKELFLGKKLPTHNNPDAVDVEEKKHFFRKIMIAAAIGSFIVNVMLVKKTYNMAYRLLEANNQIKDLRSQLTIKKTGEYYLVPKPIEQLRETKQEVPTIPSRSKEVCVAMALPRRAVPAQRKEQYTTVVDRSKQVPIIVDSAYEQLKRIDEIQ